MDPKVPLEVSLGALVDAQSQGKIRHIGLSNVSTEQLAAARKVARVVSVQNRYNLSDRSSDSVLDVCERDGLAFLPWRPIASDAFVPPRDRRVEEIAPPQGVMPAQEALAWCSGGRRSCSPIPGTSSIAHLEENIGAAAVRLSDEELEPSRPSDGQVLS